MKPIALWNPGNSAEEDTLGGRISAAREAAGLSMEEAAIRLGVQSDTWRAWECDRDVPRANRLTTMAGVLGVSPSWLLAGFGTGPAPSGQIRDDLIHALEVASAEALVSQQRVFQLLRRIKAVA